VLFGFIETKINMGNQASQSIVDKYILCTAKENPTTDAFYYPKKIWKIKSYVIDQKTGLMSSTS